MSDINNLLTEEEKKFLSDINLKYQKHLEELSQENVKKMSTDDGNPDPFNVAEPPKHITTSQREMVIKVLAEVSTLNEQGKLQAINVCSENLYHIPIPPDTDYQILLDEFNNKFDKEITSLATKITKIDD
jgi:hypothetical protein